MPWSSKHKENITSADSKWIFYQGHRDMNSKLYLELAFFRNIMDTEYIRSFYKI